jgi:sigma54-dependent transcription regulator
MHRDPPFVSFCRDESAVIFFAQRHHGLKTMLGNIEEVAVRVRAASLGVGPAKACYPFTLLRRELSNHRTTFK